MRCDGTVEHGVHDVAEFDKTTEITVVATYEDSGKWKPTDHPKK